MGAQRVSPHAAPRWWKGLLERLFRDQGAFVGLIIVLTFSVVALAAPWIANHDPLAVEPSNRLAPPSATHFLGTDNLGRDIFSRLVYGARLSLGVAATAGLIIVSTGLVVGLLAGLYGRWADGMVMRVVDGILAFPSLILTLVIAGVLGGGLGNVVLGLITVAWAPYARLVRGIALQVRQEPYVLAARAVGTTRFMTGVLHILPNVAPPVVVLLTIQMGTLILAISGLSFLGVGAQPPTPEWGLMINTGRPFLTSAPQLMVYPGLAIFLAVLGFNLLGDGVRDVLDPRTGQEG